MTVMSTTQAVGSDRGASRGDPVSLTLPMQGYGMRPARAEAGVAQDEFAWIYGTGTQAADGTPVAPEPFVFRQLPIWPWFGLRAEF